MSGMQRKGEFVGGEVSDRTRQENRNRFRMAVRLNSIGVRRAYEDEQKRPEYARALLRSIHSNRSAEQNEFLHFHKGSGLNSIEVNP